jgi:hypothetical protein
MNHTSVMPAAQASVSYKLSSHTGALDWSKGAAKRNAGRTCNNVPSIKAETKPQLTKSENCAGGVCTSQFLNEAEIAKKVQLLVNMTHACKIRVPELLAKEATLLGKFDFTRLMNALEERGNQWSDEERFYIFKYPNGVVGSVWLGGMEVYRSLNAGV